MRIGELLVRRHGIADRVVSRALETQRRKRTRLASLLIEMGALDFDDASRALGEQRGVPCALAKHLTARDSVLTRLVPSELARAEHVLPLGRTSAGVVIVCARDPSTALQAQLQQAIGKEVALVVIPASRLDVLIAEAYSDGVEEFEVDLGSAVGVPAPPSPRQPAFTALDPGAIQLSLADIDDVRVAKDPSQSGSLTGTPQRTALPPPPPPFEPIREALEQAATRDAATDAVLPFLVGRFEAVLVLAIRGRKAIGYRGSGPSIGEPDPIAVDLDVPSTVQRALDARKTSIQPGTSSAQDELARLLGTAVPSAVPVLVGSNPVAVIVVGDPIHGFGETERSLLDLHRVATALGAAYQRIAGTA
jgi:hypothetical protein